MNADELLAEIEAAIKTIVDRNISSENHCFVNVQTVLKASEIKASSATFRRLCKSLLGKSPLEVIHDIRLDMAKELLKTSEPLEVIAIKCGFSDHCKFTKKFKESVGVTPSEYRQKLRSK